MIVILGGLGRLAVHLLLELQNCQYAKPEEEILLIDRKEQIAAQEAFLKEHEYEVLALDFTDDLEDVQQTINMFLQKRNVSISNVIISSGVNSYESIFSITPEAWNRTWQIGLTAPLFIVKCLLSNMENGSSIIFISSMNGVFAHQERIDYGAVKAAMNQVVRNLSLELEQRVYVNAVLPGYIFTEENMDLMFAHARLHGKNMRDYAVSYEDIVRVILFLMYQNKGVINGQLLLCDRGYSL